MELSDIQEELARAGFFLREIRPAYVVFTRPELPSTPAVQVAVSFEEQLLIVAENGGTTIVEYTKIVSWIHTQPIPAPPYMEEGDVYALVEALAGEATTLRLQMARGNGREISAAA